MELFPRKNSVNVGKTNIKSVLFLISQIMTVKIVKV